MRGEVNYSYYEDNPFFVLQIYITDFNGASFDDLIHTFRFPSDEKLRCAR